MSLDTSILSFNDPVFHTYAIAASIMILKMMLQPWITVVKMMTLNAGFRSPEDSKKSPINPKPHGAQLDINEKVDRSRRMNLNDLESIPGFLVAGILFVLTQPTLLFAQIVIWGYVASRAAHFVAYSTAQLHDVRAFCWTWSSVAVIVMAVSTLIHVISL